MKWSSKENVVKHWYFCYFSACSWLLADSRSGEPRGSQSCWQSCVNTWSSDCTCVHLFAWLLASLGSFAVNQAALWVALYRKHTHTSVQPHTKTHMDVHSVIQRPCSPPAGPSLCALLITFPFIPNAIRFFSELQNNRVALNCTATEHTSSLASSAIIQ